MLDHIATALQLLLVTAGVTAGVLAAPDAGSAGLALALVLAAAIVVVAAAAPHPRAGTVASARARRDRVARVLLPQSDPDAAGRPRPRAPGSVA